MAKSFKNEVIVGICIIVGAIAIFFVVSAIMAGTVGDISGKIIAAKALLARRAELVSNLAQIKKAASEVGAYGQKMSALLPPQDQLLNLPQALQSSASAHAISFSFSFRGTPTVPQPTVAGIATFSADASGKIDNLLLFLKDIELSSTRYIIGIDNFDLSRVDADNYHLVFQGRAFFR